MTNVYIHTIVISGEPASAVFESNEDAIDNMQKLLAFSWNIYCPHDAMPCDPFMAKDLLKHINPDAPRHFIEEVAMETVAENIQAAFQNEHPIFTKAFWRKVVNEQGTELGYWEWLVQRSAMQSSEKTQVALFYLGKISNKVIEFADRHWSVHQNTNHANIDLMHKFQPCTPSNCSKKSKITVETKLTVSSHQRMIFATANLCCESHGVNCDEHLNRELQEETKKFLIKEAQRLQAFLKSANLKLRIDHSKLPVWNGHSNSPSFELEH